MILTTSTPDDEEDNNSGGNSGGSGGFTPYNPGSDGSGGTNTGGYSSAPYDADIAYGSIKTTRGTTTISIGSGNNKSFIVDDEDNSERQNVPATGYIMYLEHKLNTFSAITVGTGN